MVKSKDVLEKDIKLVWTRNKFNITGLTTNPDEFCGKTFLQISTEKTLVMVTTRIKNLDNSYFYGFYLIENGVSNFSNLHLFSYNEYLSKDMIYEILDCYMKEEI